MAALVSLFGCCAVVRLVDKHRSLVYVLVMRAARLSSTVFPQRFEACSLEIAFPANKPKKEREDEENEDKTFTRK